MCIYIYICTYTHIDKLNDAQKHIYTYVFMYIYIYAHMFIRICIRV